MDHFRTFCRIKAVSREKSRDYHAVSRGTTPAPALRPESDSWSTMAGPGRFALEHQTVFMSVRPGHQGMSLAAYPLHPAPDASYYAAHPLDGARLRPVSSKGHHMLLQLQAPSRRNAPVHCQVHLDRARCYAVAVVHNALRYAFAGYRPEAEPGV